MRTACMLDISVYFCRPQSGVVGAAVNELPGKTSDRWHCCANCIWLQSSEWAAALFQRIADACDALERRDSLCTHVTIV